MGKVTISHYTSAQTNALEWKLVSQHQPPNNELSILPLPTLQVIVVTNTASIK